LNAETGKTLTKTFVVLLIYFPDFSLEGVRTVNHLHGLILYDLFPSGSDLLKEGCESSCSRPQPKGSRTYPGSSVMDREREAFSQKASYWSEEPPSSQSVGNRLKAVTESGV
jgi:hypothetical protein